MEFTIRYPHGVLTEQEGGVSNEAINWESAIHVCRKHRIHEVVCKDSPEYRNSDPAPKPKKSWAHPDADVLGDIRAWIKWAKRRET